MDSPASWQLQYQSRSASVSSIRGLFAPNNEAIGGIDLPMSSNKAEFIQFQNCTRKKWLLWVSPDFQTNHSGIRGTIKTANEGCSGTNTWKSVDDAPGFRTIKAPKIGFGTGKCFGKLAVPDGFQKSKCYRSEGGLGHFRNTIHEDRCEPRWDDETKMNRQCHGACHGIRNAVSAQRWKYLGVQSFGH